MSSLNFITAIIAERLGYSRANALAIAETLSESDRDKIEGAARDRGAAVTIAALIYGARLRAAKDVDDPEKRRAAMRAAAAEAAYHNKQIRALSETYVDASPYARRREKGRESGLRVVPDPPPAGDGDPVDC